MHAGREDTEVEAAVTRRQRDAAVALAPELAPLAYRGEAGVRAGTPDGWPLIGRSATPGVFLVTGARRNGWLLAPLVAEVVAAYVGGRDPGPWAPLLHPRRFDPA